MANNLDPVRKKEILDSLVKLCPDHSMSEAARELNITPSSVRWHGVETLGLTFKKVKCWTRKKIVKPDGQYFNVYQRENWLV